jgi:hypothetical protein
MRARAALAAWLKAMLDLAETLEEEPVVDETTLPAASVRSEGTRQGDTLDGALTARTYLVGLFAPAVGAEGSEEADTLRDLERRLVLSLQSPARASLEWEHIEAEPLERTASASVWRFTLYTRSL